MILTAPQNSSRPSFQAIEKLRSVLREPFQPLYDAYQGPALQLTSAVLSNILDEKLSDAYIHGDPRLYAEWDKTAYVLLSGVLVDVGKFLYPTICGFFFRERSQAGPRSSVELCVTAFSILSEAAHGQKSNQIFLRDGAYLGPARLGAMISTSRDYLITESLLTLFARLLSTERAAGGGSMRTQIVQETLGSPELFKCNEELARILHEASTSDWNTIAIQLISAMAKSDITYPQPFSVKEINACGYVFPQPDASDRVLANVILPTGDVCDSLMVPYGHIRMVNIDTPATTLRGVGVTVGLSSAPKVGNTTLKVDSGGFYLAFSLGREDLSRFMETLRRRGIGKLSFINSTQRVVKPKKSISLASEVKFTSNSFLPVPAPDFQVSIVRVGNHGGLIDSRRRKSNTLRKVTYPTFQPS
ncbi:hypothetical protein BKA83DRAFT_139551 [Pisolithus microcarpus]|nr:hypothetical protein BKA83DRAFT_139551 [Pisolithus microcarpus]